ncbi:SDR family NAD(P)-dependent oxidoreductase [Paenibacillus flagellatus]|uniref:Short-chain dehydrogenase n=1 Tax=Paenibacillus flagellatus TaxID=2211139 RepID=A0A2V5K500_9BACL|nr:SDR family NAD(P)-dependent oxidoreductase [Paenibacillus flagellatus]PYI54308.1 short-chain dehydrogenase [Paenibacillus flagellatus]
MSWHDKVVLVTGAGSGIGRAVVRQAASRGAKVSIVDLAADRGEQTARELAEAGCEAIALQGDVGSEADAKRAVAATIDRFGRIDVLVNCAAVCPQVRLTELSLEQWNRVLASNLTSVFLFGREVVPHMLRTGGGSIVNVASVHALGTLEGYSAYAASKGGIVSLTRAMALDFAKQNVRVNAVLPGAVHTPMLEASVKTLDTPKEQIMESWNAAQPIGRVGDPDEIAAVILFAASDENSFMTGSVLVADGGMTAEL